MKIGELDQFLLVVFLISSFSKFPFSDDVLPLRQLHRVSVRALFHHLQIFWCLISSFSLKVGIFRSERVLLLLEMHPSGHRLFPNAAHQTPSARHVLSRFRFGGIRSFACELKVSDERHPACVRACVRVKFAHFKRISKNEKKIQELLKSSADFIDVIGMHLVMTYFLVGKGEVRFMSGGLGWGAAHSLASRLLPFWVGAR